MVILVKIDFGNAVIAHYNINIFNIYIIVTILPPSVFDFDK